MHVNRHPFTLFLPGVSLRAVLRVEGLQDDAVHRPLRCQSRGRVELEHRARGRRRQILQRCLRRARHAVRVLGNSHRAMKAHLRFIEINTKEIVWVKGFQFFFVIAQEKPNCRYEAPVGQNRWDSPLLLSLKSRPLDVEQIYDALFSRKAPPPNQVC